MRKNILGVK